MPFPQPDLVDTGSDGDGDGDGDGESDEAAAECDSMTVKRTEC